jgi:hypothetical protein
VLCNEPIGEGISGSEVYGLFGKPLPRIIRFGTDLVDTPVQLTAFRIYLFAVIYIWPSVARARHKLLWDDEFFTLYLSRTKSWNDLLAALATGADQHPPSFYYLTHLIFNFAGTTHLTLRLTAIVGFGAACLCLWEIVSLTANRTWSMAAMLLPLRSSSYY